MKISFWRLVVDVIRSSSFSVAEGVPEGLRGVLMMSALPTLVATFVVLSLTSGQVLHFLNFSHRYFSPPFIIIFLVLFEIIIIRFENRQNVRFSRKDQLQWNSVRAKSWIDSGRPATNEKLVLMSTGDFRLEDFVAIFFKIFRCFRDFPSAFSRVEIFLVSRSPP